MPEQIHSFFITGTTPVVSVDIYTYMCTDILFSFKNALEFKYILIHITFTFLKDKKDMIPINAYL